MYVTYAKKLLGITDAIDDEYDILMDLSEKNKESTDEYTEHLSLLYEYVTASIGYCQQFSIETLEFMLSYLNKLNSKHEGEYNFSCASGTVGYVLDKLYAEEKNNSRNIVNDDENLENEIVEDGSDVGYEELFEVVFEEIPKENYYFEEYDNELDDNIEEAMGIIYLGANKRFLTSIKETKANSKEELKYQKTLLRKYNTRYKYLFLTQSIPLELNAIQARFNPFQIFMSTDMDFQPIYYNEAIEMIISLYAKKRNRTRTNDVCEDFFGICCFEEILSHLDTERIIKLKEICQAISNGYDSNNYGEVCLFKIKKYLK